MTVHLAIVDSTIRQQSYSAVFYTLLITQESLRIYTHIAALVPDRGF